MPPEDYNPALDGDRDMDPEDGSAWVDETGSVIAIHEIPKRYIIITEERYEVTALNYEEALSKFNDDESTFLSEETRAELAEDVE
jgi:hypothetical protein